MKRDLDGITVNIGVTIPQQTVNRCLDILGMYLTDNPDVELEVSKQNIEGNEYRYVQAFHRVYQQPESEKK